MSYNSGKNHIQAFFALNQGKDLLDTLLLHHTVDAFTFICRPRFRGSQVKPKCVRWEKKERTSYIKALRKYRPTATQTLETALSSAPCHINDLVSLISREYDFPIVMQDLSGWVMVICCHKGSASRRLPEPMCAVSNSTVVLRIFMAAL